MVMYFQDDFWDAINKLESIEDQNAAIVALVRYHFEQSEPKNPIANAILTVCKDRIELSKKRSKAGATRKQTKSKTETKLDQSGSYASHSLSNSTSSNNLGIDNQQGIDYMLQGDENELDYAYAYRCIALWQTMTGMESENLNASTMDYLQSQKGNYTIDEVKAMLEYKREEWSKKGWDSNFYPKTLFNPENFKRYMNQSKDNKKTSADRWAYDDDPNVTVISNE